MSEKYTPITGGCFCGAVRYEAEASMHDAYYCCLTIYFASLFLPSRLSSNETLRDFAACSANSSSFIRWGSQVCEERA